MIATLTVSNFGECDFGDCDFDDCGFDSFGFDDCECGTLAGAKLMGGRVGRQWDEDGV